jgi:hypothetical protein
MSEVLTMFALASVLAVYGGFKYLRSSNTEYEAFNHVTTALQLKINELDSKLNSDHENRFNALGIKMSVMELKTSKLESELIEARGAFDRKSPTILIKNPVPVTIEYRNQIKQKSMPLDVPKKAAKQIKALSK